MVGEGLYERNGSGREAVYRPTALGAATSAVAVWKLLDPQMPVEDYLAFVLGVTYVVMGVAFLRAPRQP